MPYFKSGVVFDKELMHPMILSAIPRVDYIFDKHIGEPGYITSALDGRHSRTSKHYWNPDTGDLGEALDYRSHHIDAERKKDQILSDLKAILGKGFDVVLEGRGENWEHYHIEYDPKG